MLSEAVMLALGEHIGRQTAHDVVYESAMKAFEQRIPFVDVLCEDPRVSQRLTRAQLEVLLDPTRYTGLAGAQVDLVLGQQR